MSLRNYIKKFGKRKAGVWGRINHKRDNRAASKAVRKYLDPLEGDHCSNDPLITCQDPPFTCMEPWCTKCKEIDDDRN